MTIDNIRYEEDDRGMNKVIQYSNGIIARILQKPSEAYKKKMSDRSVAVRKKMNETRENEKKEALIVEKMRELAIRELKKEGKL